MEDDVSPLREDWPSASPTHIAPLGVYGVGPAAMTTSAHRAFLIINLLNHPRPVVPSCSAVHPVTVYDSPIEPIPQTRWESLADGAQKLREIACIGGKTRNPLPDFNDHFAVVEDWKGPDAAVMKVLMKNKFIEGAPSAYKSPLFTMFSALMGNSTNVYTACSLISQLFAVEKAKVSHRQLSSDQRCRSPWVTR
ncbi:unnamed protein product, partial [Ranitomeya imitator]